ncbi:MAG: universal stress protein [Cyclobacteriaceae bacterium]
MITFNKILVCLDLSQTDEAIIQNACSISEVTGTKEVTFLNVIKDFNIPESLKKEFPDLIDKAVAERRKELSSAIDKSFDCPNVKTNLLIRQGAETKEILTASMEADADLIILGRKEKSNSVLNTRVVRRAACNILLVPEGKKLDLSKIHVPVDFSNYSALSLETALSLTDDSTSEITIQNVYNVPSSYRYSGKTFEEFAAIMEENSQKDLTVLIRQAQIKNQKLTSIHTLDDGQNVIRMIYQEATKGKADLIVMGAKGRTAASALFIGSKAERMIQVNENIPLMVVRKKGSNAGIIESLKDL